MSTDTIVKELPRILTGFNALVKSYQQQPGPGVQLLPSSVDVARNKLIMDMVRATSLYVGMRVKAANKNDFYKHGYAIIKGLAKNYAEYKGNVPDKDVVWPSNNNPMIVSAVYEDSNEAVDATINYFIPAGDSHDD